MFERIMDFFRKLFRLPRTKTFTFSAVGTKPDGGSQAMGLGSLSPPLPMDGNAIFSIPPGTVKKVTVYVEPGADGPISFTLYHYDAAGNWMAGPGNVFNGDIPRGYTLVNFPINGSFNLQSKEPWKVMLWFGYSPGTGATATVNIKAKLDLSLF